MDTLAAWIMSIAGVALIGVLIDIILPNGQMQKYCRAIFALIMLLVIITPLPKLINQDFDFNWGGNTEIDNNYINQLYKQKLALLESSTEQYLKEEGYEGVRVTIYVNEYTENMQILTVTVNMQNLVITDAIKHINYYNQILDKTAEYLKVTRGIISGIK